MCASYGRLYIRSLSQDASKTLVHTFVFCRLDYCNSLFLGYVGRIDEPVAVGSERRRLSIVTGTRRSDHIMPVLRQLHWLQPTGTPERRLQGCDARSSIAVWHFAIVLAWPTTVVLSSMLVSDDYVPQQAEHAL